MLSLPTITWCHRNVQYNIGPKEILYTSVGLHYVWRCAKCTVYYVNYCIPANEQQRSSSCLLFKRTLVAKQSD